MAKGKRRYKRKNKEKKVYSIVSILFFLISILLLVWLIFTPGFSQIPPSLFYYFLFLAIISITFFFNGIYAIFKILKRPINKWIIITICLMTIFLIVGTALIIHTFGEPDFTLVLRDCGTKEKVGSITCNDASGKLFVGNEIFCELSPKPSTITSANVSFRLDNGRERIDDFSNYTFTAPYDSNYIFFKIDGFDEHNQSLCTEVGYPFRFYTKEENDDRNGKLISYIILLLGAILFSVPSMMNNFKNLYKE